MPSYLKVILLLTVSFLVIMPASALAASSANFYRQDNDIFDDWDICRTNAIVKNGFFQVYSETEFCPVIAGESLGENAASAYQTGQRFKREYPDIHQRAERIFAFARDKVRYTSDSSQFGFKEFAQNADELATAIEDEGFANGDCEDYAVLLAVIYKGAGFRSAIVLATDHAAALVHLPDYTKANNTLSVKGEPGWVWAEATGRNNPLGWMPENYIGQSLGVYEVEDEAITATEPPDKTPVTVTKRDSNAGIHISPLFSVIAIMWLMSLFRRRRVR